MNIHAQNIINILREIIGIYSQYKLLLQVERESIVANNLKEIQECVKKKETLVLKIRMMEETRKTISGQLAEELGISKSSLDLSYLSKQFPEPFSKEFKRVQTELISIIQQIKVLHEANKHFIEASISGIRFSFQFLNESAAAQKTYKGSGCITASSARNGMVLCQKA